MGSAIPILLATSGMPLTTARTSKSLNNQDNLVLSFNFSGDMAYDGKWRPLLEFIAWFF